MWMCIYVQNNCILLTVTSGGRLARLCKYAKQLLYVQIIYNIFNYTIYLLLFLTNNKTKFTHIYTT